MKIIGPIKINRIHEYSLKLQNFLEIYNFGFFVLDFHLSSSLLSSVIVFTHTQTDKHIDGLGPKFDAYLQIYFNCHIPSFNCHIPSLSVFK